MKPAKQGRLILGLDVTDDQFSFTSSIENAIDAAELELEALNETIESVEDIKPRCDNSMTEAQQYELGSYLNLMNSSTQLLVNPILGLQPKYSNNDFDCYEQIKGRMWTDEKKRGLIISIANLLYKIDLDDKDKKLLWKSFKGNKKFLESIEMKKKEFEFSIIETACDALAYKYTLA